MRDSDFTDSGSCHGVSAAIPLHSTSTRTLSESWHRRIDEDHSLVLIERVDHRAGVYRRLRRPTDRISASGAPAPKRHSDKSALRHEPTIAVANENECFVLVNFISI